MVRNICPSCGAMTDDPTQKFCTQCGTKLPDLPVAYDRTGRVPIWVYAGAGIILLFLLAAVLSPHLVQLIAGSSSGGQAGGGPADTGGPPAPLSPVPSMASPVVTTIPEITVTPIATTAPTTVPPTEPAVTVQKTRATISPARTYTVVTPTPTVEGTSQITLSVTQIPPQPSADSVTSSTPGAPYIDPSALEARIHELINVQRQQNGLTTLSYDSFLADIARGHSWDMAIRNFFEHENPDGKDARVRGEAAGYPCVRDFGTYYTEGISENLYQGYRYNSYLTAPNGTVVEYKWNTVEQIANQAVNGWMNSEGHRKNIMDFHFRQEGIGVSFSADDKVYVTENFC